MKLKQGFDRSFRFYVFPLENEVAPVQVNGLRIGKANWLDYLLSTFGDGLKISLSRRLSRGDDYFTAREHRRIVSVGRICYADTAEVELEQGEASLLSFRTLPEYRRRGLYVALITSMLTYLQSQGFERCYIWADCSNTASLRGIEKAGFVPIGPT